MRHVLQVRELLNRKTGRLGLAEFFRLGNLKSCLRPRRITPDATVEQDGPGGCSMSRELNLLAQILSQARPAAFCLHHPRGWPGSSFETGKHSSLALCGAALCCYGADTSVTQQDHCSLSNMKVCHNSPRWCNPFPSDAFEILTAEGRGAMMHNHCTRVDFCH